MKFEKVKEAVEFYIGVYQEIKSNTDNDALAVAILREVATDRRAEEMKARFESQKNNNGERLATQKQINLLKSHQAEIPEGLTLKQASKMIDELKNA